MPSSDTSLIYIEQTPTESPTGAIVVAILNSSSFTVHPWSIPTYNGVMASEFAEQTPTESPTGAIVALLCGEDREAFLVDVEPEIEATHPWIVETRAHFAILASDRLKKSYPGSARFAPRPLSPVAPAVSRRLAALASDSLKRTLRGTARFAPRLGSPAAPPILLRTIPPYHVIRSDLVKKSIRGSARPGLRPLEAGGHPMFLMVL